ncbi:MAG: hypothetical protein U0350_15935 [Caldilineaceae bacterium]
MGSNVGGIIPQGQLGNEPTTTSLTPVDVSGLTSGIKAIEAGDYHTCALTATNGLKCWGYNGYGQLGDGGLTSQSSTPIDVVESIEATPTATFTPDSPPTPTPETHQVLQSMSRIAAGAQHTCALTASGGVKCWGYGGNGQVGDGYNNTRYTPVTILFNGYTALVAGAQHTCALTTGGGIKCWGYNGYGQLGNGTTNKFAGDGQRHGRADRRAGADGRG